MRSCSYIIQFPSPGEAACGEYVRTEEVEDLMMPNLSNSVHPIFRPQNFAPDFPALRVLQPIRLASLLLDSDAALSWFYTVFTSRGHQIGYCPRMNVRTWEYLDDFRNTILTDEQKQVTRDFLHELAQCIKFKVQPPNADGHEAHTWWKAPRTTFPNFTRYIDIKMSLEELPRVEASADPFYKINYNMKLASAFMHELGHAATSCRNGEVWFFPGENMAEEGFSFEAQLFGGNFHAWSLGDMETRVGGGPIPYYVTASGKQSSLEGMTVLATWPNPSRYLDYLDDASFFCVRGPEPSMSTIHWNVDFAHIARLFQDGYWRTRGLGFESTRFVKTTGIVIQVDKTPEGMQELPTLSSPHHLLPPGHTHEFAVRHTYADGPIHVVVPRGRLAPMLPKLVSEEDVKNLLRNGSVLAKDFLGMVRGTAQGRWDEVHTMLRRVGMVRNTPEGQFLVLKPGM